LSHAGTHQAFENDLCAERTARLQLLVDGTDSNTAGIVLGYAARITEQFTAAI
jgi:ABC-2 type transport system permease protein